MNLNSCRHSKYAVRVGVRREQAYQNQRESARSCRHKEPLVPKKIGLSFLPETVSSTPARVHPIPFAQASAVRLACRLGSGGSQSAQACRSCDKLPTHHRSEALWRDHPDVGIFALDDRPMISGRAVREEESSPGRKCRAIFSA